MEETDGHATAAGAALLAGRYRLAEVIGRGGMAEVYRATDIRLSRPVAVKLLLGGAGDDTDHARFIAEARTLAMLSHSGLVTVLDAGFGAGGQSRAAVVPAEPEQPFLVMELVEGPTLAQLTKSGPLPLDDLGTIGVQVAEALAYVHSRGVVHRDVKPGNVLVGNDQRVKLADFGIARLVEQATRHTQTGHAIGTAAYLAPEQVQGRDTDGAADVYALGLVLLEAITGRREYAGAAAEAALARLSRQPDIPSHLPPVWRLLLTRMTALDPRDRPGAAEVASTLRGSLSRPAPVATVGVPDAVTAPILAAGDPSAPLSGSTRPLTAPAASSPGRSPRTSPIDRSGDAVARQVHLLARRLRAMPSNSRGLLAGFGVLVALLIAVAVAGGDDSAPDIPENTPSQLREPLSELHVAVNGEDG